MARLYNRAELEELVNNLQETLRILPKGAKFCLLCRMIESHGTYACWCDYESDYYSDGDL